MKKNHTRLDKILRTQGASESEEVLREALDYAKRIAETENVIAVVSDLFLGVSHIYSGKFADTLGLEAYKSENSIWEEKIFALLPNEELEIKIISELRYYHLMRHLPRNHRQDYYLLSRLLMISNNGEKIDVVHRMFYKYDKDGDRIRCAICLYSPLVIKFTARSLAVNSITGGVEELGVSTNEIILSKRERQVLVLIDKGMTSDIIAAKLYISKNTVSRHRQKILSKLQVKNSIEACRIAKSMELI